MIKVMALVAISFLSLLQGPPSLNEVSVDQEFVLRPGQEVAIENTRIRIVFDSVPEDTRCPKDVQCVWAGNGKVKLALKKSKKKSIPVIVNTGMEPREVEYRGYRVKLIKLSPEAKAGEMIPASEYEVTLRVSRANEVKR